MTRSRKRQSDALEKEGGESGHVENGHATWPKKPRISDKTDYTRWRIQDKDSCHTWHYLDDDKAAKEWPQTYAEKYFLSLPTVSGIPLN